MEISSEEAMKRFEEMKRESEKNIMKQIKALGVSKLDKGLIKEIRRLLRDKQLVQKEIELALTNNRKIDLPNRLQSLDKIDSRIEYYVNLGQIKKQYRTNILLVFIAIISLILMGVQIYQNFLK